MFRLDIKNCVNIKFQMYAGREGEQFGKIVKESQAPTSSERLTILIITIAAITIIIHTSCLSVISHMGQFPQDGNFRQNVVLF